MEKESDISASIAAITTLMKLLEHDKSETVQELDLNLQSAVEVITNSSFRITGVSSGCALFMRFITFAKLDNITVNLYLWTSHNSGLLINGYFIGSQQKYTF